MAFRVLKCKRCGWDWATRHVTEPVHCPKCKSPYWNRERMRNV
jgi:predicted Zn-ribbon and HTH transcriptional regulator